MFFEIVTRLCAKKGISITQLALELKISRSNVRKYFQYCIDFTQSLCYNDIRG